MPLNSLLPPLQALVVSIVNQTLPEVSAIALRQKLGKHGLKHSDPAFYQLMSRMTKAKLVRAQRRVSQYPNGKTLGTEVLYKATPKGARALKKTVDFYASL